MKKINIFAAILFGCMFMYSLANAGLQFLPDAENIGMTIPTEQRHHCREYKLFACPDNANCKQCSNGKFQFISCKPGYARKRNSCLKR